jgi:hypothetical protein
MPEQGAIAVCGSWAVHEDWTQPLILSFLPNGFKTALRFHPFGVFEKDADDITDDFDREDLQKELDDIYGVTRHKMRKLYPGDIYGASSKGAELVLDEGARLLDRTGGTVRLRPEDQTLLALATDITSTSAAGRHHSGRAVRNDLFLPPNILNEDGLVPQEHPLFRDLFDAGLILEDGTPASGVNEIPHSVTESGKRVAPIGYRGEHPDNPNTRIYTEDRLEVQEFTDQLVPTPGEEGFDADRVGGEHFNPFIERVIGTVIGNDPFSIQGRSKYGNVLQPLIYRTTEDRSGTPSLEVVDDERTQAGGRKAAAFLYRMTRPDGNGELFVSHDKEGHVFMSIPKSTAGAPLGGGRSLEADLKGSIKTTIGRNDAGRSIHATTRGGVEWNIGSANQTRRAVETNLQGGMKVRIERPDVNGTAVDNVISGDVKTAIDGDMSTQVRGDQDWKVDGKRTLSTQGHDVSVGVGGANYTVAASHNESIKGPVTERYARGQSTTIITPLKASPNARQVRILAGNRTETFVAPSSDSTTYASSGQRTVQSAGALSCTWQSGAAGNFSFSAPSGNFAVNLGGGAINLTTGGAVTIQAGSTVQITGSSVGINGTVGLGAGVAAPFPVVTGVPGPSPSLDPLTGLPATGNPTVRSV